MEVPVLVGQSGALYPFHLQSLHLTIPCSPGVMTATYLPLTVISWGMLFSFSCLNLMWGRFLKRP